MLGHVATVDHGADPEADLVLAVERIALSLGRRADLGQRFSVASMSSARLRARSAASSGLRQTIETLAGIVVGGDLRHVALVEQRQLQGAALGRQSLDGRGAQRGDPVEAGWLEVGVDARLGDHAAIADQHDAFEPKARAQLA